MGVRQISIGVRQLSMGGRVPQRPPYNLSTVYIPFDLGKKVKVHVYKNVKASLPQKRKSIQQQSSWSNPAVKALKCG